MGSLKPKVVNNFSVTEIMAKIIYFLHELGNTVGNFTSADNERIVVSTNDKRLESSKNNRTIWISL